MEKLENWNFELNIEELSELLYSKDKLDALDR